MLGRGAGRILFTSSIASTMPGAFQGVYNPSKSFVQSFALARCSSGLDFQSACFGHGRTLAK